MIARITMLAFAVLLMDSTQAREWRIASLIGVASVIPVVLGVTMLFLSMRKSGPRMFPSAKPPRRLGAPRAGGNHAVIDLGPPPP